MRQARVWIGVSAIALSATAHAQETPPAIQSVQTTVPDDVERTAPVTAPPMRREFRDAQGRPVSPEIQQKIEEALRNGTIASAPVSTEQNGDIVVTGDRPRGSVIGDVPAERSFDTFDIRAFGATDVSELFDAIAPQVRSNRGRDDAGPVTLLNGRRVSSFAEIARIPTDAIERMDVFPEELALRYGFRADQKVVNIVTFPNFRSVVTQTNALVPTDGGTTTAGVSADQFVINGDTRMSIGGSYNRTAALTEDERGLIQPGGDPALGQARTLLPSAQRFTLNGVVGGPVSDEVGAALNAQFEASDLTARLAPDTSGAIERDTTTRRGRVGSVVDGRVGKWIWSLTGGYERTTTETLTDRADGAFPRDRVRSANALAQADLVASGPIFSIPAGPVTASIGGSVGARSFQGTSRLDEIQLTRLGRDRSAGHANIDLPIVRAGGAGIGSLSLNANMAVERLSDVGTLQTLGSGLTWSPIEAIDLVASHTREEGAPTVEQLSAPRIVTPSVRTFDFTNGTSVDVPRVFGGNPALIPDDRRVLRIGLAARPLRRTDLTVSVDYVDTRTDDAIIVFPILTPALEAAFPDRFQRDAAGRLTAIDARPLNIARSSFRQLRTGVSFTRTLGNPTEGLPPGATVQTRVFGSAADAEAWARRRNPNATLVFASPDSASTRRVDTMRSRIYVNLFHNWTITDTLTLVDGGAALDRLNGFATDLHGGRRRHEIDLQIGAFKRGIGGRLRANWQSGTRIDGLSGNGDLAFADLGKLDLSLFIEPAERLGGTSAPEWMKRVRLTLSIDNLFNARPLVRDGSGQTPIAFQPDYLDPLGRTISFSMRKRF